METKTGMRSVATFDGVVGLFILTAGLLLLAVADSNLRQLIEQLLRLLHLSNSNVLADFLFDFAEHVSSEQIWLIASILIVYAVMRITEAYGLWYERRWGAKLAVLVCGLSVPFEVYAEFSGITFYKTVVLVINVWIVIFMVKALRENTSD